MGQLVIGAEVKVKRPDGQKIKCLYTVVSFSWSGRQVEVVPSKRLSATPQPVSIDNVKVHDDNVF